MHESFYWERILLFILVILFFFSFIKLQVPETDDESTTPMYREFTQLLLDGQKIADDTKRTHVFVWRGYKGCISSQIPKLTSFELKRRYNLAMEFIEKKEKEDGNDFFQPTQGESSDATNNPASSSSSARLSSSSNVSSDYVISQDITQIPETQFQMEGKRIFNFTLFNTHFLFLFTYSLDPLLTQMPPPPPQSSSATAQVMAPPPPPAATAAAITDQFTPTPAIGPPADELNVSSTAPPQVQGEMLPPLTPPITKTNKLSLAMKKKKQSDSFLASEDDKMPETEARGEKTKAEVHAQRLSSSSASATSTGRHEELIASKVSFLISAIPNLFSFYFIFFLFHFLSTSKYLML